MNVGFVRGGDALTAGGTTAASQDTDACAL